MPSRSVQTCGSSDLAHSPRLIIAHRLDQLLLSVHHERPIMGHRFLDRHSCEQQQSSRLARVGASNQPNGVPGAETGQLTLANFFLAVANPCRSLEHVDKHLMVTGKRHGNVGRSEEHTSELQSRSDLVCRLLLEKK